MMTWMLMHEEVTPESLGYIPSFLDDEDATLSYRADRGQLSVRGLETTPGFTLLNDGRLAYPGDRPMELLAETVLRDEVIRLYEYAWLLVMQPDGTYEVSRCD